MLKKTLDRLHIKFQFFNIINIKNYDDTDDPKMKKWKIRCPEVFVQVYKASQKEKKIHSNYQ